MNTDSTLRIISLDGVDNSLFDDFKDLGFKTEYFTEGPKAFYIQDIIDHIIITTISFPYQLALNVVEGKLKSSTIANKVFKVWNVLKGAEVHRVSSSGESEKKEPCLRLSHKISENESYDIAITGNFSEEFFSDVLKKHFKLLKKKTKNRAKEDKLNQAIKELWQKRR